MWTFWTEIKTKITAIAERQALQQYYNKYPKSHAFVLVYIVGEKEYVTKEVCLNSQYS